MDKLRDFVKEEIDFNTYDSSFGMGETTTECQEDTYDGCGDTYHNVSDDEGNTAFSWTSEEICPA